MSFKCVRDWWLICNHSDAHKLIYLFKLSVKYICICDFVIFPLLLSGLPIKFVAKNAFSFQLSYLFAVTPIFGLPSSA